MHEIEEQSDYIYPVSNIEILLFSSITKQNDKTASLLTNKRKIFGKGMNENEFLHSAGDICDRFRLYLRQNYEYF